MPTLSPAASIILQNLQNPYPNILDRLEGLNRQLNFATSKFGTESQFGTLTASTRNYKPFIIGFIPPDNPVNFIPIAASKQKITVKTVGDPPNTGPEKLPDEFFVELQAAAGRINCNPDDLLALFCIEPVANGQVCSSTALNKSSGARGLCQWLGTKANFDACKMTKEQWQNMQNIGPMQQLKFTENYFLAGNSGGKYPYKSFDQVYFRVFDPNHAFPDPATLPPDKVLHAAGSRAAIDNSGYANKDGHINPITVGNVRNTTKTVKNSANYIKLKNQSDAAIKRSNGPKPADITNADKGSDTDRGLMSYGNSAAKDIIGDMMGRRIEVASERRQIIANYQTIELQRQINIVKSTPPLIFLINPSDFKRGYEQNIDDSVKGRYGHIVHRWLEKPMTISCSGVTAGQYIVDAEGSGGLTNFYRVFSISYQNLLSIMGMYKNNGIIFAGSESDPGIPILAMSLFIYYDSHIYIGSFDSMSVDDKADKPFNLSYDFKFTARYDMDCDNINGNLDMMITKNLKF